MADKENEISEKMSKKEMEDPGKKISIQTCLIKAMEKKGLMLGFAIKKENILNKSLKKIIIKSKEMTIIL